MSKTHAIIDVDRISKTFSVPSVRRETVREHVMDLFRRRAVDRLTVLDDISFSVQTGETLGIMGRAEDPQRNLPP